MIGARLKELLKKNGVTQAEFAEIMNLSPSSINKYCQDITEPTAAVLVKFAEYFKVSTDYLLSTDKPGIIPNISAKENLAVLALRITEAEAQRLLLFYEYMEKERR